MREFIINYAEYILAFLLVAIGVMLSFLIHGYRHKMDEEQKRSHRHALLFGVVVGLPITALLIWQWPWLVGL